MIIITVTEAIEEFRKYVAPDLRFNIDYEEYHRAQEEYVAVQVLKRHGWDAFVKRCKEVGIEYFIKIALPCQGPDHQCSMFCKRFNNCEGYSDYIDDNVVDYVTRKVERYVYD